jgi:hypothetical protein
MSDLPDEASELFLRKGLDDPNQLESVQQIRFYAHGISRAKTDAASDIKKIRLILAVIGQISGARNAQNCRASRRRPVLAAR